MKTTERLTQEAMERYMLLKAQVVAEADGEPTDCHTILEYHMPSITVYGEVDDRHGVGSAVALAPAGTEAIVVLTEIRVGRHAVEVGEALLAVAVARNQTPSIKVVEYWYITEDEETQGMGFEAVECDDCRDLFAELVAEVTSTLGVTEGNETWN